MSRDESDLKIVCFWLRQKVDCRGDGISFSFPLMHVIPPVISKCGVGGLDPNTSCQSDF